ncbi:LptF/LptG family permease [Larkinella bovis]|uniref:LptF/LptG family permease n=1 Tax=Larkinella bovis TaxID=683041 RepID=A0ABW0I711_9BACT
MKRIDKLVLKSFWGPFVLTLCVVVFIFLMRLMMFYIDQFVSKDIELAVFGKILIYFSLITIPIALPLAVLLSSLMTYGNLGEFFELTAMKSAGISLTRAMRPLLIVATGIAIFSFWFNNKVAPWANLKGYSLLWDIKSSKATLSIKEGIFYNDLPGYSIKADRKEGDLLRGMVIYKHQENGVETGNREIILADSGRMFTTPDKQYLIFELYNGNDYTEYSDNSSMSYASSGPQNQLAKFLRNGFQHYKLRISLDSYGLKRTDEQQFEYHEYMKNLKELATLTDSLKKDLKSTLASTSTTSRQYYSYQFKQPQPPILTNPTVSTTAVAGPPAIREGKWIDSLLRKPVDSRLRGETTELALSQARNMLSYAESNQTYLKEKAKTVNRYELESHHKFTQAISCFIMFLIGAPLGAIIKKGGFGIPVLVSIIFFILLYVLTLTGDKYAKDGLVWVPAGAWMANVVLLPVGLYLMKQARNDSRLFDKDVYTIWWERLKKRYTAWRAGRLQTKVA